MPEAKLVPQYVQLEHFRHRLSNVAPKQLTQKHTIEPDAHLMPHKPSPTKKTVTCKAHHHDLISSDAPQSLPFQLPTWTSVACGYDGVNLNGNKGTLSGPHEHDAASKC